MRMSNRLAYLSLLLFSALCFSRNAISQTKSAENLTRNDVVIKPNETSIYLCVDQELWKTKKDRDADLIWLRIHNNTIWTIRFRAEKMGTSQKLLTLSNGKIISGLTNQSTAFPEYEFEPKKVRDELGEPAWGDVGTANWLPKNTSALFAVPIKYFKIGTLFLEYKYEWEFTGTIADESHAPEHRIYFDIADISQVSDRLCK